MFCHVSGCNSKAIPKRLGLSFHRFPKDEFLRRCWERVVGGVNWTAPPAAVVCSDHFGPNDFDRSGKLVRLNKGVIPSIFPRMERDENLGQLTTNVDSLDIDDNSNSNFSNIEGPSVESMMNYECSQDCSDNGTPINEAQSESRNQRTKSKLTYERITNAMKRLTENSNMKFMENFDPEKSNREKRKLSRKFTPGGKKLVAIYDDKGHLIASGKDVCDCMDYDCPGCHFFCTRCQSPKCGHECRVNRKWTYECIEIEGTEKFLYPTENVAK